MSHPFDADTATPETPDSSAFHRLEPGSEVGGRFEILKEIGTGGSSVVYAARDLTLKRDVALKVLRADRLSRSSLTRLRREVRVARDVHSPNLVPIYDIGEDGRSAWISMELIEGETLRSLLTRSELSVERVLEIATQLLEALAALHAQGVVHRDIKPGNVMIDTSGAVRLTDLGLARRWESLETKVTATDHLVGTLEYLSPEQALGLELDGRSDLYSFGVLLFELLTGELPFKGASLLGTVFAHVHTAPVDVRKVRKDVPRWLATVITRLLAKRREERYQNAEEVLHDIRQEETNWRFVLRRVRLRLTIAIALLVALVVVITFARSWYDSRFDHLVEQHPQGIEALDRRGRSLWALPKLPRSCVTVAKLNPSEPVRVVAIVADADDRSSKEFHVLSIIDTQSGQTIRTVPIPANNTLFGDFSNTFFASKVMAVDLDHDGLDEIVVTLTHSPFWPSYTAYYEPGTGTIRTIFLASGRHSPTGTVDIDGDGVDEVIFFGINNRMGTYNTLAAVKVLGSQARPELPVAATTDRFVASTPDAEYSVSEDHVLVWYTLLPSPYRQYGEPRIDRDRREIVIEIPDGDPIVVDFDGFLSGTTSPLEPAERRRVRQLAYRELRTGIRMMESERVDRAHEHIVEARDLAGAAVDPMLSEWIARNEIRALIRQNRLTEAEAALETLVPTATLPADVLWDAGREFHLGGSPDKAADHYARALSLKTRPSQGRKIYEYVEQAVLALGELERWNDAERIVRQFEVAFPERTAFFVSHFRAYIEWRSTGRLSVMPDGKYEGPDLQKYWRHEFRALEGFDEDLLHAIDAQLELTSESKCLLRALRAEALHRIGRTDEARREIRAAYRDALVEKEKDTAVRAHFDLVESRFRRIAEGS